MTTRSMPCSRSRAAVERRSRGSGSAGILRCGGGGGSDGEVAEVERLAVRGGEDWLRDNSGVRMAGRPLSVQFGPADRRSSRCRSVWDLREFMHSVGGSK
jgi:hypothetical protein